MPITITKTLQNESYDLYFLTEFRFDREDKSLDLIFNGYRSKGHFQDGFVVIIKKEFSITNKQVIEAFRGILNNNNGESYTLALDFIERQAVQRAAFFTGGVVEPRDTP